MKDKEVRKQVNKNNNRRASGARRKNGQAKETESQKKLRMLLEEYLCALRYERQKNERTQKAAVQPEQPTNTTDQITGAEINNPETTPVDTSDKSQQVEKKVSNLPAQSEENSTPLVCLTSSPSSSTLDEENDTQSKEATSENESQQLAEIDQSPLDSADHPDFQKKNAKNNESSKQIKKRIKDALSALRQEPNGLKVIGRAFLSLDHESADLRPLIVENYLAFTPANLRDFETSLALGKRLSLTKLPLFTANPNIVLYGSEQTDNGIRKVYPPLSADLIWNLILYLSRSKKVMGAGSLISGLFQFDESRQVLISKPNNKSITRLKAQLQGYFCSDLDSDTTKDEIRQIKQTYIDYLFSNHSGNLFSLFRHQVQFTQMAQEQNKEIQKLNTRVTALESAKELADEEKGNTARQLFTAQNELLISESNNKKLKEKLEQAASENELLVAGHHLLKKKMQKENQELWDANTELADENEIIHEQLDQYTQDNENLKSTLAVKEIELEKISSHMAQSKANAEKKMSEDLILSLQDPLLSLEKTLNSVKTQYPENSKIQKRLQNIETKILDVLEQNQIKKIGVLNEEATFDSAIHQPLDQNISQNDHVIIRQPGWICCGNILVKAQVEKKEVQ